jgi:Putative beta-lactamase-inhibitor-like, PepSY-like
MKITHIASLSLLLLAAVNSVSQPTKVPQVVQDSLFRQYPDAQNVKWSNEVFYLAASFESNGEKMVAEYNTKGVWRGTKKNWTYEKLPAAVLDAFKKHKYADWPVTEVKIVSTPKEPELYRLTIERNEIEKKNLFFNKEGRLMRDTITW